MGNAPDKVAVSWTATPVPDILLVTSFPFESRTFVETVGLALLTVSVSPLAPHWAVKPLLFASPLYDASQL